MIDKTARSMSFFNKTPLIKLDKNDINEMIEFSKENKNSPILVLKRTLVEGMILRVQKVFDHF